MFILQEKLRALESQADVVTEKRISEVRAERQSFGLDLKTREKEYTKEAADMEREIQRLLVGQAEFSDPSKTDEEIVRKIKINFLVHFKTLLKPLNLRIGVSELHKICRLMLLNYPTDPIATFELRNPSQDVPELNEIR